MKRIIIILFCCLASFLLPPTAGGEGNFPLPEFKFESGYSLPVMVQPAARASAVQYLDVTVLFAVLALAAYLVLKRRSRREIFLLMLFSLAYFGFWRKGCICAIGAIQNITLAVFDSSYAVPLPAIVFFMLPLFFALFFGRVFCAAVCPLGAMQDVFVVKPLKLPPWLEQALGLLPYVYLGLAVLFAATGAGFVICRFDPFVSFFRLSGNVYILGLGACFLLVGMFIARPYCRFFCPYSVMLNWFSRLSRWHATITPDECIHCRLCEECCPFDAINKPAGSQIAERRETGVRRLALLLVLFPLLVASGSWAGSKLAGPLSQANARVLLAERVWQESRGEVKGTTFETDVFRGTGKTQDELYNEALALQGKFRVGGGIFGGFLGLVFIGKLLALSVRRTRVDYEPDRGKCLSCGRCFSYCPREKLRLKKMKDK